MIFKEFQGLVNKAGSRYGLIISVTKRARDIQDKIIKESQDNRSFLIENSCSSWDFDMERDYIFENPTLRINCNKDFG